MSDFIKVSVQQLEAEIEERHELIAHLRSLCEHQLEHLKIEHDSNTGNYDPSADCYWTNIRCQDCGKRWHLDDTKYDIPRGDA